MDNTTAIAYVNNMGGTKSSICNKIAKEIWDWVSVQKIWISAAHIPGKYNVAADRESRTFQDSSEWMISNQVFNIITDIFGMPEIDLFATRTNHKLPEYVSWKPDPGSVAIDAFSITWNKFIYCLILSS